jgi:3',5'-cyclic-AMP phosphodiesterase
MIQTLKFAVLILSVLLLGCKGNPGKSNNAVDTTDTIAVTSEFFVDGMHAEADSVLLRVALLGDAEPKPCAEFPHMDAAVKHVNTLAQALPMDFAIGVGDIAHKGTEIQYEEATEVLKNLSMPFYPIMGNEEHGSTVERFLLFAQMWNSPIESASYVVNHDQLAFVFASPDHGRDFDDSGAQWILDQIKRLAPKPVVLVVHGAQQGVYSENPDKGISNQLFIDEVITQPNLAVVISGDLHMDMDRVNHSKKLGNVHYLHVPALERTKIPDETNHTPMFRVMTVAKDGKVFVDTYAVGDSVARQEHAYAFALSLKE